jgi:hypothetical protein
VHFRRDLFLILKLPDDKFLVYIRKEPRRNILASVLAVWKDQLGVAKVERAMLEDISDEGTMMRITEPIVVGSSLEVQWVGRQFTGTVRYCRADGMGYVLGIQKDPGQAAWPVSLRRQKK